MNNVFFADARPRGLSADLSLPAKFRRLLQKMDLGSSVRDRTVAVKMHLGGNLGYTTIHPVFISILVEECRAAGARRVSIMDGSVDGAELRGYTELSVGAPLVSCFGATGKYVHRRKIGFLELQEAIYGGNAWDADVFIDFSHVKGHGMCGFGGAIKNIAMGCVTSQTRGDIHRLQGGIAWDVQRCIRCGRCVAECPNQVNEFDKDGVYRVNWHQCTFCRHCIMICPKAALSDDTTRFEAFQEGLARVAAVFLEHFPPERRLFINLLTNITVYCDCWGFSSPSLVPDIGILAGRDIIAVEKASLNKIKPSKLLREGLPIGASLARRKGHLFERIHGKDPYLQVRKLEALGFGDGPHRLVEVR